MKVSCNVSGCDYATSRRLLLKALGLIVFVYILSACVSAPVQEMSDARQALIAAESVNASEDAPTLYQLAKDQIGLAEQALHNNQYTLAKKNAEMARQNAIQARELALSRQN